jgi:hypothetical protein
MYEPWEHRYVCMNDWGNVSVAVTDTKAQFDAKNWASVSLGTWMVLRSCLPTCQSQEAKVLRMKPRWMLILHLTPWLEDPELFFFCGSAGVGFTSGAWSKDSATRRLLWIWVRRNEALQWISQKAMLQGQDDWDTFEWLVLLTCVWSGCKPWWLSHWYRVRCVFSILVWMRFPWHSLVWAVDANVDDWTIDLAVDINHDGCTTWLFGVDGKSMTWTTSALCFTAVNAHTDGWTTDAAVNVNHDSWTTDVYWVSCVFPILVWMCFLWHSLVFAVDVNLDDRTTDAAVDVNDDGWTTGIVWTVFFTS